MSSTKSKKNVKKNSTKNYFIAFLIIILAILLTVYIFQWFKVYEKKEMPSPLTGFCNELQYNELENSLVETPNTYFIYISYTDNKDAYRLEKQVKRIIVDNELQNKIYYLNVTHEKNNDNFINDLNEKLKLNDQKVKQIPTIIYYNNGTVEEIIDSQNKMFNSNDFKKLIKKYRVEQ